jgi:hypothetical protein
VEKNRASNKLSNENELTDFALFRVGANKIRTGWKKTVLRTNYLLKIDKLILLSLGSGQTKSEQGGKKPCFEQTI